MTDSPLAETVFSDPGLDVGQQTTRRESDEEESAFVEEQDAPDFCWGVGADHIFTAVSISHQNWTMLGLDARQALTRAAVLLLLVPYQRAPMDFRAPTDPP